MAEVKRYGAQIFLAITKICVFPEYYMILYDFKKKCDDNEMSNQKQNKNNPITPNFT